LPGDGVPAALSVWVRPHGLQMKDDVDRQEARGASDVAYQPSVIDVLT
jgi:hypothetical protein